MNLITVQPRAIKQLRVIMAEQNKENHGLRIQVAGGGCSGMMYKMEFEPTSRENDRIFEFEGISFYVDPKSALFLAGVELDYDESLLGGGFKFQNPNATASCGCGKSFSA